MNTFMKGRLFISVYQHVGFLKLSLNSRSFYRFLLFLSFSRHCKSFARPFIWALLPAGVDPLRLRGQRPPTGQPAPPPGLWSAQSPGPGHLEPPIQMPPWIRTYSQPGTKASYHCTSGHFKSPEVKLPIGNGIHNHILSYLAYLAQPHMLFPVPT